MNAAAIIAGSVALAVVSAFALWFILWAKRQGRQEAERDAAQKGIEHARQGLEIDENVHHLSDADRERLLNRRD